MLSNMLFGFIWCATLILLNFFMILTLVDDREHKKSNPSGLKNHFNHKWRDGLNKELD